MLWRVAAIFAVAVFAVTYFFLGLKYKYRMWVLETLRQLKPRRWQKYRSEFEVHIIASALACTHEAHHRRNRRPYIEEED